MTRRECGTCRFFEQSGIGESGWCRNQRCREIVGLALVRRQELACRVGWDKDYYESANGNDMIPGQERPLPSPGRQRTGYQGVRPDDIIIGVEQPRAGAESFSPPTARSRVSNVGEAHRRALERRQVAQQSGEASPGRRLERCMAAPERSTPAANTGSGRRDGRSDRLPAMKGYRAHAWRASYPSHGRYSQAPHLTARQPAVMVVRQPQSPPMAPAIASMECAPGDANVACPL